MRAKNTTLLSSKFQISIPLSVRVAKVWKAGQEFAFIPNGKGILLMPIPKPLELAGSAKGAKVSRYRDRNDRF